MHRVTKRERIIYTSEYQQEINKAKLCRNLAYHLQFIFYLALYDKFGLTYKQLENFCKKINEQKDAWHDDNNKTVTSGGMVEYCRKRSIDVIGWVKSIPMPQKLYMADIRKGRAVLGADWNIESVLASAMYLTIPTLKETYRFSNARIGEFMKWVAYYIDSYWKKQPGCKDHFLSDEIIRQTFIEDEHWDIVTGKKVG